MKLMEIILVNYSIKYILHEGFTNKLKIIFNCIQSVRQILFSRWLCVLCVIAYLAALFGTCEYLFQGPLNN